MRMRYIPAFFRRSRIVLWALSLLFVPRLASGQPLQSASLDDLLAYADAHSAVARSAEAQSDLAHLQNIAAIANTVNLRGSASFTSTDNFLLPVNFLPAEIFGGPAGTFREVRFGQQFVSVASIAPQFDLVNPSTWSRVASAKSSAALTEVINALNRRNLHESLTTAYYNYQSALGQQAIARKNLANADTIAAIMGRRYEIGILRRQDYNNALANRANLADFVQQLETRAAQQLLSIRALLGMSESQALSIAPRQDREGNLPVADRASSQLLRRQAALQAKVQHSELQAVRLNFAPTLSLVAAFNWQQNSNDGFYNSASWIRSRYVGLKLSVPLPTETKLWSQAEEYRIGLRMKGISAEQAAVQEDIQNQQLDLEIVRAAQAVNTTLSVQQLKQENYNSALLNYQEGILSADQLLLSFTDLLNAELASENARWNLSLQMARLALYQSITVNGK